MDGLVALAERIIPDQRKHFTCFHRTQRRVGPLERNELHTGGACNGGQARDRGAPHPNPQVHDTHGVRMACGR
jgi:hypothetical protein